MKRVVTILLIFSVIFGSMAGYETSQAKEDLTEYKQVITHPVKGTLYAVQEDEESQPDAIYKKSTRAAGSLEDLGRIMNEQMECYLSAAGSPAAQVKNLTSAEMSQVGMNLKSKVTFSLSAYRIPYDAKYTLQYVYEAIGTYPNLSALHTMIGVSCSISGTSRMITNLNVYSPVSAEQMKAKIQSYKSRFNELIAVPKQDKNMSDMEKLLYLHDEIVIRANYDLKNGNDAAVHTPMSLLLEGGVVCQAYASVMNQAANALGINSLQLASTDHAWNAVELDGKWYYLDATFDDPVGNLERDYVSHRYFLFNLEDIKGNADVLENHTLDELDQTLYGMIPENMGNVYRNILPKELQVQMNYLDGSWYYGEGKRIYQWDGVSQTGTVFSAIPVADNRACAVCEGKLYVSGSDGVSIYENGQLQPVINGSIKKMVIIDGVLNYKTAAGWQIKVLVEREPEEIVTTDPPQKSNPASTQTTENAVGVISDKIPDKIASEKSVTPGRVTISSVKNKKKKSIYLKFKKVKNAAGYQYSYATNNQFKKSKSKTTKKLAVTIKKLKKKKTYYVRVRAYSVTNGKKKYGKWSKVKKVKIKK